jgi:hypothetical protein
LGERKHYWNDINVDGYRRAIEAVNKNRFAFMEQKYEGGVENTYEDSLENQIEAVVGANGTIRDYKAGSSQGLVPIVNDGLA